MVDRCPYCGGAERGRLAAREMMFGLRETFTYARCAACGSLWQPDPPADMSPYYRAGYYSMGADPKGAEPIRGAELWTRALLRLPPWVADRMAGRRGFPQYTRWLAGLHGLSLRSRVADVGCGEGDLLLQMSRHGFRDLWGFDPFLAADRDAGSAHLRAHDLAGADGPPFDLIMFNHALEHVPDPCETLRAAIARLAPGGTILVRVPVAGSYSDRHYGTDWVGLDPPRHLTIPSRVGLEIAAGALGLAVRRVFYDSLPLQFWASEQYARDVPLHDPRSGWDAEILAGLTRRARKLNAAGDGDSAGFMLRAD